MRRRRELREVSQDGTRARQVHRLTAGGRNGVRRLKSISSHESAPPQSEIQQEVCLKYLGEVVTDSDARCHGPAVREQIVVGRSEEHTSELQSLMRISFAVF